MTIPEAQVRTMQQRIVQAGYRMLVKEMHPDKATGSSVDFRMLTAARDALLMQLGVLPEPILPRGTVQVQPLGVIDDTGSPLSMVWPVQCTGESVRFIFCRVRGRLHTVNRRYIAPESEVSHGGDVGGLIVPHWLAMKLTEEE